MCQCQSFNTNEFTKYRNFSNVKPYTSQTPYPLLKVHKITALWHFIAKILCYYYLTHYNNNRLYRTKNAISNTSLRSNMQLLKSSLDF